MLYRLINSRPPSLALQVQQVILLVVFLGRAVHRFHPCLGLSTRSNQIVMRLSKSSTDYNKLHI